MPAGTLVELFDRILSAPRPDLLRYKADGQYRDLSTGEFGRRVRDLCAGLIGCGVQPGDRVALLSENRPEWPIADFAIQSAGAANVPIYTTLTAGQIRYILADCEARVALVSTPEQLDKLREAGREILETLIVFDPAGLSAPREVSLEDVLARGGEAARKDPGAVDERRASVGPDTLASIIYTSGTTGDPKGVMLTHANFVSNVEAVLDLVPMDSSDTALSFLPLSHVFERMVEYWYFRSGVSIAYAESIETVAQNLLEVRPTVTASVPRVFEKVQARVLDTVRSGPALRRKLFFWALETGRRRMELAFEGKSMPAGLAVRHAIADRLVLSKLRGRMGGRIRYFISGGAPLPPDVARFFFSAGFLVLEGYGLTETSPVIAVNLPDRHRIGTVGPVIPGVEVRIAQDGEILVRGPNVMKGYWKKPEATAEALADGWFHTGDIGHIDGDGYLVITDRKKDLIVTSGGKNVAPQPIESALKSSRFIVNAVCIGDRRRFISALIVPDFDALRGWAETKGLPSGEAVEALLARPDVAELFEGEIDRATAHLAPYEKIKKFALLERDFSIEKGEITPTMKVRRRTVSEKYADRIEEMYR